MIKDIKYQGHTATPSDYECMDGELAGCYNLIPEDGALHPIMPPTTKFTLNAGEDLLWIHEMTGHTHYILMKTTTVDNVTTQSLEWVCEEEGDWTRHDITDGGADPQVVTITGTPTIASIGNTLIVNDDNGVQHFLWSTEGSAHYEALGQKPPMLNITFGLHSDFAVWPDTKNTSAFDFKGASFNAMGWDSIIPQLGQDADTSPFDAWAAPQPVMAASADSDIRKWASEYATFSIEGIEGNDDDETYALSNIKSTFTNSVLARINKFVNEKGTEDNKFVMPFFVRYAYRLYDGSYIMHSYPVLMIPNSRGPVFALEGFRGLCLKDNDDHKIDMKMCGRVYGCLSELVYTIGAIPEALANWKDLIQSVDIGVSAPVFTYDQSGYVWGWTNMDQQDAWESYYSISRITKRAGEDVPSPGGAWAGLRPFKDEFETLVNATLHSSGGNDYGDYFTPYNSDYKYPSYIATLPLRKTSEVNDSITSAANFYIVARLKLDELEVVTEAPVDMEDGTLIGLLGRRTMPDDYHSHDTLKASLMYGFNGRMNFAGVERTPHNPLSPAIQFAQSAIIGGSPQKQVAVSIKNDMQTLVVQSGQGLCSQEFPHWVYYPDANAKTAYVKHAGNTYELALTPHDLLNGAYWLGDITKQDVTPASTVSAPTITTGPFIEQNKVYTSNAYNPFVFEPTNINSVGTGKILGLCAAVKPLADDQYGKAPLYVFSTEGIWAMDTTTTGTYGSVWPLPRDVLSKIGDNYNAASITQLDDAVLFATDKGIMMLSGNQTQCITDAISSEYPFNISELPENFLSFLDDDGYDVNAMGLQPFSSFLASCRMIYDYNHQRIIVYNSSYNYAYVYSLKDHKWGMMTTNIDYGINSYPEALAVTDADTNGHRNVVNLSTEVLIDVNVKGLIMTRPLKLDEPDALKTIDTIIQRGKFNFLDSSRSVKPIRSILFGSRDLYNWFLISSSTDHYLRGFSGTPYKYFRIVALVDFLPDESVYGATIQYKPRYLNRPR